MDSSFTPSHPSRAGNPTALFGFLGYPPCGKPRSGLLELAAALERKLEVILEEEARDWLRQRGIEAHMEDRPTKAVYTRLRATDASRRQPIEEIRDGSRLITHQDTLPRAHSTRAVPPQHALAPALARHGVGPSRG